MKKDDSTSLKNKLLKRL